MVGTGDQFRVRRNYLFDARKDISGESNFFGQISDLGVRIGVLGYLVPIEDKGPLGRIGKVRLYTDLIAFRLAVAIEKRANVIKNKF